MPIMHAAIEESVASVAEMQIYDINLANISSIVSKDTAGSCVWWRFYFCNIFSKVRMSLHLMNVMYV